MTKIKQNALTEEESKLLSLNLCIDLATIAYEHSASPEIFAIALCRCLAMNITTMKSKFPEFDLDKAILQTCGTIKVLCEIYKDDTTK